MFPEIRLRRLRQNESIRKMLDIPFPGPEKMIWPAFVIEGENIREPISSMPGQYRLSIDQLIIDLEPMVKIGIGGVLIFGQIKDEEKDSTGTKAFHEDGVIQKAIRKVKSIFPHLIVVADACMCAYTDHGHCGSLGSDGTVNNDLSLNTLSKIAVSLCDAGVDIIAPSAMMDGQVKKIRKAMDDNNYSDKIIMSYSTKFASSMYGPFRDAEKSTPQAGNRKSYQASYGNLHAALRESELDENEGADILMVKPALFYLDVLTKIRSTTNLPIAAYNVSGEYSMMHATAENKWGDLKEMVRESTIAMTRSGADIIITYWANQYEKIFKD